MDWSLDPQNRVVTSFRCICYVEGKNVLCGTSSAASGSDILSMSNHIAALSRSCFFHLRQLRLIRQSLTLEAMNTLVQAFITTRLDSCNSVLVGVSNQLLQRMQVIQNTAARFITAGARRFEHDASVTQPPLATNSA